MPQLRDDEWDLAEAAVTLEEGTGILARRWVDLASAFVADLDGSFVWRSRPIDPFDGH